MEFIYATGGREKYYNVSNVNDCVTRAIANATGKDYKEIYDTLNKMGERESVKNHRGHKRTNSRNGVFKETWKRYLRDIGWIHVSTCEFGSTKSKVKFVDGALPEKGTFIVQLARHLTCLKNGVIYDTYDCSSKDYYDWRTGETTTNDERCVYGYWRAPTAEEERKAKEANQVIEATKEMQRKAIENTKQKIKDIKNKYNPTISKLEKKLKEIQHKLIIETNRMNKEIAKVKKEDGDNFCNQILALN